MLPGPSQALPDWRRLLETAFHSPVTIACLQAAIAGSKFPTYLFKAPQNLPQTRSASNSSALPGPRSGRSLHWRPVARFPLCSSSPSTDLHSPSGLFRTLPDRRVQSASWPESAPSHNARSPFAPRCRFYWNSAGCGSTFQARYAIGGLLFLKPLGTFFSMRLLSVTVK